MKEQDKGLKINLKDDPEGEIYSKVFMLMNAIHAGDVTHEMDQKKQIIFNQIEKKIKNHTWQNISMDNLKKWMIGVVACFIFICPGICYLFYVIGYKSLHNEMVHTLVTVNAPCDATTHIHLPDQTMVTLNAGSTLIYPVCFDKERKVELNGEGFFDVAKSEIPFVVQTDNINVKVLGTRFNMRAYKDEEQTLVTMVEGEVEVCMQMDRVESVQLTSKQQFAYNHITGEFIREGVQVNEFTDWQLGNLHFRDVSFESIAKTLERKFNIPIVFEDPDVRFERYYVKFEHNEHIDDILKLLSYKRKWSYVKEDGIIKIIKRNL